MSHETAHLFQDVERCSGVEGDARLQQTGGQAVRCCHLQQETRSGIGVWDLLRSCHESAAGCGQSTRCCYVREAASSRAQRHWIAAWHSTLAYVEAVECHQEHTWERTTGPSCLGSPHSTAPQPASDTCAWPLRSGTGGASRASGMSASGGSACSWGCQAHTSVQQQTSQACQQGERGSSPLGAAPVGEGSRSIAGCNRQMPQTRQQDSSACSAAERTRFSQVQAQVQV